MNGTKIVSGGSAGGALAAVIVYVLGRLHVQLTAEDGTVSAVVLVAVVAFIAHNGLVGVGRILWRGQATPPPAAPPVSPPPTAVATTIVP